MITTRKPTCRASWPLILLAGVEGAGKTWAAVEATAMADVDRAFFIELGEGMADEYGKVPGADFEIIEHDGTVGMIREAISWASQQPAGPGQFNLLIFDSLSELWALLSDNAQQEANSRARRRGKNVPDQGAQITMDLWNRATDTWEGIIAQLHRFPGPVVATARMEVVTIMDDAGNPTSAKDWKIQAQKRLPFRVNVLVEARSPRVWTMTKIATTVPELQLEPGKETTFKNFSVATLLEKMGIGAGTTASAFSQAVVDGALSDEAVAAAQQKAMKIRRDQQTEADYERFMANVKAAERQGDMQTLVRVRDWASGRAKSREALAAAQAIERIAQTNAAEQLEAEFVDEPVA